MPNAPLSEPTLVNDEVHNWYKLEMSRLAKTPPRAPAEVLKDAWAHRTCESHLPSRELHTLILSEKTYPTTLDADYNYKRSGHIISSEQGRREASRLGRTAMAYPAPGADDVSAPLGRTDIYHQRRSYFAATPAREEAEISKARSKSAPPARRYACSSMHGIGERMGMNAHMSDPRGGGGAAGPGEDYSRQHTDVVSEGRCAEEQLPQHRRRRSRSVSALSRARGTTDVWREVKENTTNIYSAEYREMVKLGTPFNVIDPNAEGTPRGPRVPQTIFGTSTRWYEYGGKLGDEPSTPRVRTVEQTSPNLTKQYRMYVEKQQRRREDQENRSVNSDETLDFEPSRHFTHGDSPIFEHRVNAEPSAEFTLEPRHDVPERKALYRKIKTTEEDFFNSLRGDYSYSEMKADLSVGSDAWWERMSKPPPKKPTRREPEHYPHGHKKKLSSDTWTRLNQPLKHDIRTGPAQWEAYISPQHSESRDLTPRERHPSIFDRLYHAGIEAHDPTLQDHATDEAHGGGTHVPNYHYAPAQAHGGTFDRLHKTELLKEHDEIEEVAGHQHDLDHGEGVGSLPLSEGHGQSKPQAALWSNLDKSLTESERRKHSEEGEHERYVNKHSQAAGKKASHTAPAKQPFRSEEEQREHRRLKEQDVAERREKREVEERTQRRQEKRYEQEHAAAEAEQRQIERERKAAELEEKRQQRLARERQKHDDEVNTAQRKAEKAKAQSEAMAAHEQEIEERRKLRLKEQYSQQEKDAETDKKREARLRQEAEQDRSQREAEAKRVAASDSHVPHKSKMEKLQERKAAREAPGGEEDLPQLLYPEYDIDDDEVGVF